MENDKYTDEQIDAAVSKTADDFLKRTRLQEYVQSLRQESKDNAEAGKVYWVPSRMLHPVYRKGDGFWKWLRLKWWSWRDKR